jgi:hypothetical protein
MEVSEARRDAMVKRKITSLASDLTLVIQHIAMLL